MIVNVAVPSVIAVNGQRMPSVEFHAVHGSGVTEPATSADAADEATMYAAPVHVTPVASTAATEIALGLAPTTSTGVFTEAVIVFAALA